MEKYVFRVFRFLLKLTLFACYGAWVLLLGLLRAGGHLRTLRAGLAGELRCPHGHCNPTRGRLLCGNCHAEYHGFIGVCSICGAGAGWTPCIVCGVGVRFPWVM